LFSTGQKGSKLPHSTDRGVNSQSDVTLGKRSASHGESPSTKRLKLLAVSRMFSAVVREIGESLKSLDPKKLLKHLSLLMASKDPKIPLFTPEFLASLETSTNSSMLLNRLTFQWSWIDHSILEELVSFSHSKAANKLLEKFKSELGQVPFLSSSTVPSPCPKMLPIDGQSRTLLTLTTDVKLLQCTLKYIGELKSQFSTLCGITRHSLQLVAVKQSSVVSTIFYWMVSKQLVPMICAKVQANCSLLQSSGLLEVSIYPNVVMATDGEVRLGPLALLTIADGKVSTCLLKYILYTNYTEFILQCL